MSLLPCQVKRTVHDFRKCKFQLVKVILAIAFNKKCLEEKVIPKYIKVNIKNNSKAAQLAKVKCELYWLRCEIRAQYKRKELLNRQIYVLHLQLSNLLTPVHFICILDDVSAFIKTEHYTISQRHNKKLTALISKRNSYNSRSSVDECFFDRVINSTTINFNDSELNLLNKGLKHNIAPKININNIKEVIVKTKIACDIAKLNNCDKNAVGNKISKLIDKHTDRNKAQGKFPDESKVLTKINKKLKDSKALIVKADKGSSAVIMYEKDYLNKTLEFFQNNNIKEINSDPTLKLQAKLKKVLKECHFLLTSNEKSECMEMNPSAPKLRSQPKIHKADCPIRPIVDSQKSPFYKISKELNMILTKAYTFEENFCVNNSSELSKSIKDIPIPNTARFASFDIVNLYTNIPVKETISIIKNNLLKYKKLSLPEIYEFIEILTLVLSHNYFSFNNKFYKQEDGLAMGSCLASLLANIYINQLETSFFKTNMRIKEKIIYYKRYVDDTLILFDGTVDEIDHFANELNKLHPNIKFTVEHETDSGINFLDLTIRKYNGKHRFKIYRKPTTTDVTINNSSCHPEQHKMAYYRAMLNRLEKIPLDTEEKLQELKIIKLIAHNNGYSSATINKLHSDIKKKYSDKNSHMLTTNSTLAQISPQNSVKYVCIPFIGKVSYQIANIFRAKNIRISFSTNNKIKDKLIHNLNLKTDLHHKSGIYKLNCSVCPKFYIGQTGRSFKIRYREHMDALRLKNLNKSTFATHMAEHGETELNIEENLKILHFAEKGMQMNLLEEIEIYSHINNNPESILNDQLELKNKMYLQNFVKFL